MDSCSVGFALQAICHKKTYPSKKKAFYLLASLNDDEQELLKLELKQNATLEWRLV